MQWSDEVTRIQIKRGDSQIASLDVGEAPSVEVSGPERREGSLVLHIRVRHPRSHASLAVLFTGDDGETWSPVAIDPAQSDPLIVDVSSLPGGESCRFRAVATAEFKAASADSESFSLPRADRSSCRCERGMHPELRPYRDDRLRVIRASRRTTRVAFRCCGELGRCKCSG